MGASSRKPWTTLDLMRAKHAAAFVVLLQMFTVASGSSGPRTDWSSASSSSSSSSSSESSWSSDSWSSSNGWSPPRSAPDFASAKLSFVALMSAHTRAPFLRKRLTPKTGPRLFSFNRIQEEWGESSISCATAFRFESVSHLRRLKRVLRVPDSFKTPTGYVFSGEEGLLILLNRLAFPSTLAAMCWQSGRGTTALSECFLYMNKHIYNTFPHLHDHRSLEAFRQMFPRFAKAVWRKALSGKYGAGLSNCVGFIDGTVQRVARPGRYQRVLFNGHKRCHSVKWQGIVLPNGIMPMPFGPVNGRRNDGYMVQQSGIQGVMRRCNARLGTRTYCLYGDAAYGQSRVIQGPFKESEGPLTAQEQRFNSAMSRVRVPNEWGFAKVKVLFAFVGWSRSLKPDLQPIGYYWPVAQILTNCHTCVYGSQTSTYFNISPPTLEAYVQLGSEL